MKIRPQFSFIILLLYFQFYGQNNTRIEELELQEFILDTISYKLIKSKNGTEINFSREDFDVEDNQNLTLELKEYINSSHFIFVNITSNGQSVNLRKNRRIPIKLSKQSLKPNEIYYSHTNANEKFSWIKLPLFSGIIYFNVEWQIDEIKAVRYDSINYYKEKYYKEAEYDPVYCPIMIDRLGWFKIE